MEGVNKHDEFVLQMIQTQGRVHAYILSLVLNKDVASDLLQQTNLVLLQKRSDFKSGTNFGAWACRVAYYEVLAHRRDRSRDLHVFSDATLALIAGHARPDEDAEKNRLSALEACMQQLPERHRDLVIERYRQGSSIVSIAQSLKKSPAAVSANLYRIRTTLLQCVKRRMQGATA